MEFPWYAVPGAFLIVSPVRRHTIRTACIAAAGGVTAAVAASAVIGGPAGWQQAQGLFGTPGPPHIVSAVALGSSSPSGIIVLEVRGDPGGAATIDGYELADARAGHEAVSGARGRMCAMGRGKHALGTPIRVDRGSGAHVVLRSWRGADKCGFGIRLLTDRGVTAPVMLSGSDPASIERRGQ